jgi:hypothetical protein
MENPTTTAEITIVTSETSTVAVELSTSSEIVTSQG